MSEVLALLGSTGTLALGLLGLLRPDAAANFTSMQPIGRIGRSEIRATYGGFFLALGACGLLLRDPLVWSVIGVAWLGAAAGRAISVPVDESYEPKNLGGIVFEATLGLLLLAPHWLS